MSGLVNSSKVDIDSFDVMLKKTLDLYHEDIIKGIKKQTEKSAKKLRDETKKQKFDKDTGDYREAISVKKTYENSRSCTWTWYVKPPYHRLSHLLEKGHARRNGGRKTKAYHFISRATTKIGDEYVRLVTEVIKNGG